MSLSAQGKRGLVTAPHALAAEAGAQVLARGANAIEAAIAVSAALSVVYPHMTGLGGDAFWLISDGSVSSVRGLAAASPEERAYEPEVFRARGLSQIPFREALSAMTMPGMLRYAAGRPHIPFPRQPGAVLSAGAIFWHPHRNSPRGGSP